MKDTIDLGPCPPDEDAIPVGDPDYLHKGRGQCVKWRWLLAKTYVARHGRPLPPGLQLRVVANEHEFGVYYEVGATYDPSDSEAVEAAFWLEANAPLTWDKDTR